MEDPSLPSSTEAVGATDALEDLAAEQHYLDRAYECLGSMQERTGAAAADAAVRSAGDWDATAAHAHLVRRLSTMDPAGGPLCFGRIDEASATTWYIGRRHVESSSGEPVVVDWRAPVAVPFYRATFRDPLELKRRRRFILDGRRLVDLLDEDFDDPDSAERAAGAGLPDPLLAELGRARTGAMRDIVATIAAEQDAVIRAPLDLPLVVQGGPGTGKTAVGLHRAAYLLYEHRSYLEREGVLVLGPNRIFLAYISQVLPSLGEVAVVQTTIPGLVAQWPVRAEEPAAVAALKGDARLSEVVARACLAALKPPANEELAINTRWGVVRIEPDRAGELLEAAVESGGTVSQRRVRHRRAVARHVLHVLAERRPEVPLDLDAIQADVRTDRAAQRVLDRMWPAQSPASVIRALLGRPATMATAAAGVLSADEQRALRRSAARSVTAEAWTVADLALLDEADSQLSGSPRRYGHIVVDEAQDLTPMAFRMVQRRSTDGRSVTILGDLAQATAPGALTNWDPVVRAFGGPGQASVQEISTGYRVPRPIMETANRVLSAVAPNLSPTESVRSSGDPPEVVSTDPDRLVEEVTARVAALAGSYTSTAVITPVAAAALAAALRQHHLSLVTPGTASDAPHVSLLAPDEAKGLEFDAVIVVEPGEFLALPAGGGLLYIALTRAVQHLTIVHSADLPDVLFG
jgi:DNA helicase IV